MKRFPLVALFSFAVCFVGCDNSSSTDAEKTSDVREVETIYNLGKCSDSHKGELAFVIDDEREYICFGGKWIPSEEVENKLELSSKVRLVASRKNCLLAVKRRMNLLAVNRKNRRKIIVQRPDNKCRIFQQYCV